MKSYQEISNNSLAVIDLCKKEQEIQHFFHWDLIENAHVVGVHHHPKLCPVPKIPSVEKLVTLNNAPYEKNPQNCGLCFYTKDSIIERIWNNPIKYLKLIVFFVICIIRNKCIIVGEIML